MVAKNNIVIIKSIYDKVLINLIKDIDCKHRSWNSVKKLWIIDIKSFYEIQKSILKYIRSTGEDYLLKGFEDIKDGESIREIVEEFKPMEKIKVFDEKVEESIKKEYLDLSKEIGERYPFLRNYQKIDVAQMIIEPKSLNCDDVGLGKTIEVGAVIDYSKPQKVLIVCPKAIIKQWQQELKKFYNLDSITIPDGKKRFKIYEELKQKQKFILIVNYEKISIDLDIFYKQTFFNLVVLDEITKLKDGRTKNHKAVKQLRFNRVMGLTGTPVENSVQELYSLMNIIDYRFFGRFYDFADSYLTLNQWGGYEAKIGISVQLGKKLKEFDGFIRWKKAEVLSELPEVIQNYYRFQLSKQEKQLYTSILNEKAEVYNSKEDPINLGYDLAKIQVLNGFCSEPLVYFPDFVNSSKKKLFLEVITDYINGLSSDRKIVCFSQYKRVIFSYYNLLKSKKINSITITGNDSIKQKEEKLKKFKIMKNNCVLLCTDALAYGVNLQEASFIVNIDLPWNPAVLHQRIGRLHRIGQENKVSVINLVAEDTIEDVIVQIIYSKMKMFDDIISVNEKSVRQLIKQELKL